MNTSARGLILSASGAFGASFLLPAYRDFSGWDCFRVCLNDVVDYSPADLGFGLYYPAFVVANFVFVAVALVSLAKPAAISGGWEAAGWMATGQVLSWPVLNVVRSDGNFVALGVGYYLWLIAYAMLLLGMRPLRDLRQGSAGTAEEAAL